MLFFTYDLQMILKVNLHYKMPWWLHIFNGHIESLKEITLVYSVSRILKWHRSPSPKILIELVEGSATKEKTVWMLSSKNFEKSRKLLFPKIHTNYIIYYIKLQLIGSNINNAIRKQYTSEIPVANHKGKRLMRICRSK